MPNLVLQPEYPALNMQAAAGPLSIALQAAIRGLSAFEVAVANGFEGDEEAWLASLEGEPAATPGSDKQVVFNDAGALAGDVDFAWDKAAKVLTIGKRLAIAAGALGSSAPVLSSSGWSAYNSGNSGGTLVLAGNLKIEGGSVKLRAADALQWVDSNAVDNLTGHAGVSSSGAGVVDVTNGPSVVDGGVLRDLRARHLLAPSGRLSAGGIVTTRLADTAGAITCTPSAAGGSLPSATYYIQIVAVDANGLPNNSSNVQGSAVVVGPNGSIAIAWAAIANAASYRVCIGTASYGQAYHFTTTATSFNFTTTAGATAGGGTSATNQTGAIFPGGTAIGMGMWTPHPTNGDLVMGTMSSAHYRLSPYSGGGNSGNAAVYAAAVAIGWSSAAGATNGFAVGAIKVDNNTVGITDGGTGAANFRDLKVRTLISTGPTSHAQYTTATEPSWVNGSSFFNTDLDKLRIGGAAGWETVTSA